MTPSLVDQQQPPTGYRETTPRVIDAAVLAAGYPITRCPGRPLTDSQAAGGQKLMVTGPSEPPGATEFRTTSGRPDAEHLRGFNEPGNGLPRGRGESAVVTCGSVVRPAGCRSTTTVRR